MRSRTGSPSNATDVTEAGMARKTRRRAAGLVLAARRFSFPVIRCYDPMKPGRQSQNARHSPAIRRAGRIRGAPHAANPVGRGLWALEPTWRENLHQPSDSLVYG